MATNTWPIYRPLRHLHIPWSYNKSYNELRSGLTRQKSNKPDGRVLLLGNRNLAHGSNHRICRNPGSDIRLPGPPQIKNTKESRQVQVIAIASHKLVLRDFDRFFLSSGFYLDLQLRSATWIRK